MAAQASWWQTTDPSRIPTGSTSNVYATTGASSSINASATENETGQQTLYGNGRRELNTEAFGGIHPASRWWRDWRPQDNSADSGWSTRGRDDGNWDYNGWDAWSDWRPGDTDAWADYFGTTGTASDSWYLSSGSAPHWRASAASWSPPLWQPGQWSNTGHDSSWNSDGWNHAAGGWDSSGWDGSGHGHWMWWRPFDFGGPTGKDVEAPEFSGSNMTFREYQRRVDNFVTNTIAPD